MPAIRVLFFFAPLVLIGCPSDDPEPIDDQAACQASCVASGHVTGLFQNGSCACSNPPGADAGQAQSDTGLTPPNDSGAQPPANDSGTPQPTDGGSTPLRDAGFSNHDIGVIDPDAGEFPMTRAMACSDLCQWGFTGWRDGIDGGPGEPVECPQDREVVFGAGAAEACTTACEAQTAEWDSQLFVLLQDCVQTSDCGERTACTPETVAAGWQAPICTNLCEGIADYRTPASSCQPPRFGDECNVGCATELRRVGALHGTSILRCYENVVSLCVNDDNRNACQCRAQATCHGRDFRLAQRLAWQYCSLRDEHCRPPGELATNMVDCIDRRILEVLGHRNLPELQACFRSFEANPTNCFENLDGCLTPF